jgi:hypothetical protein
MSDMDAYYVLLGLVGLALGVRLLRPGFRPIAVDLSRTRVRAGDGAPVRLGELVDRPTVLVLVRYYG